MYSCTFIGHRDCPGEIKETLRDVISHLIVSENVRTFYVGTHGQFDRIVYEVLCYMEKLYDIKILVVLAYLNRNQNAYYDMEKTIYPESVAKAPFRFAINIRNTYMIEKSDFMACYIEYSQSNSVSYARTALRKGLKVINLGKLELSDTQS